MEDGSVIGRSSLVTEGFVESYSGQGDFAAASNCAVIHRNPEDCRSIWLKFLHPESETDNAASMRQILPMRGSWLLRTPVLTNQHYHAHRPQNRFCNGHPLDRDRGCAFFPKRTAALNQGPRGSPRTRTQ